MVLMLVALQEQSQQLTVADGGFCTGPAWVAATAADKLSIDRGPDFRVIRFDRSQTDWWGIYVGNFAQVSDGKKSRAFVRDGVKVDRVRADGEFKGYLATTKSGLQNHFFGSPFKGDQGDMAFFDRVDFGPSGQAKCRRNPLP